jgi:cytochrome c oxidase subunit II
MKRLPAVVGLSLLIGGCNAAPLGYLSPSGPAARTIANLGWGLIAISVAACLIVLGLLAYAIGRERPPDAGALGGGNDRTAIGWIVAGTGISTMFLVAAAIWTLWAVQNITNANIRPGLIIDVTGHQWWWEAHYRSDEPSREFTTANDIVIPTGVPVQVHVLSSDVIHSFWVPRLAGKTETIPGADNTTRIEADEPGTYRGQCTQFCGLEHAHMAFFVIAKTRDDFNAWWDHQLQSASVDSADPGQQVFLQKCAACHAIRGISADGILGPNLSHFGSRTTIGAGTLENNAESLAYWIDHTQTVKPGTQMPSLDLPSDQVDKLTAFLEGLK